MKKAKSPASAKTAQLPGRPPGRALTRKHGLQQRSEGPGFGSDHLRIALGLSGDVPLERVCEDAARRIEELEAGQPAASLDKPKSPAKSQTPAAEMG